MTRIFANTVFVRMSAAAVAAALLAGAAPAQACGDLVDIVLVNEASDNVYAVYISPVDWSEWGNDLLGTQIVRPGQEFAVTPSGDGHGCFYDVLVTFEWQGQFEEVIMWNVDLCTYGTIVADNDRIYTA